MKRTIHRLQLSLLLFYVMLLVSCKKQVLESQKAENPPAIDGSAEEWNRPVTVNEKFHIAVALQNDEQHLYLLLTSDHPEAQRQLINSGLIVWFDEQGDGRRDFGIKYPFGFFERGLNPMEIFPTLFNFDGSWKENGFAAYVRNWCSDVQLLDAKGNNLGILNHRAAEECGIRFQMAMSQNKLTYELAVPLKGTKKITWDLAKKAGLHMGFETPQVDFSAIRRPMGGFAPGGADAGGGGMPMGGGRGMGRGPGGGGGDMPMPPVGAPMGGGMFGFSPVNWWMKVSLTR